MRYRGVIKNNMSGKFGSNVRKQTAVCALLLVILCVIKLTPDDVLIKTKNAIKLVLNQQTSLKNEAEKIKKIFTTDEGVVAMTPVSEFENPAPSGEVVVGFGVQDANNSQFHYGVDIKIPQGENIVAAAGGKVTEIATNDEYGSYMVIAHDGDISTLYAHLNEILPDVGEQVTKGKAIARANKENNTVYFEIRHGETYLNPADFIDFGE